MAEPFYPAGYTRWQKVYSGKVLPHKRGELPLEKDAEAFFLIHTIARQGTFSLGSDVSTPTGFWTVQILTVSEDEEEDGSDGGRSGSGSGSGPGSGSGSGSGSTDEDDASDADDLDKRETIWFEQSVMLGALGASGFGGLLTTWSPAPQHQWKFKTRICDGQHVPAVVEPYPEGRKPPANPEEKLPEVPGLPRPFNVRLESLTIRTPEMLPKRATSFALMVCIDRFGEYKPLAEDLDANEVITVLRGEVEDLLDHEFPDASELVSPMDLIWFKMRAINADGHTDGEAIRDTWPVHRGTPRGSDDESWITAGYESYKFLDQQIVTDLSEQYYTINESVSGGFFSVNYGGDVVCPAYKCRLPPGCMLRIIHDYWVGQFSDNDIYYSLSYKPRDTAGNDALWDFPTGTLWSFIARDGDLLCGRSTRVETFRNDRDSGTFQIAGKQTPALLKAFRSGATLLVLAATYNEMFAARSYDEGRTWVEATQKETPMITGIKALAAVKDRNGCILVYGVVNPGNGVEKKYDAGDAVRVLLKESVEGLGVQSISKIAAGKDTVLPKDNILGLLETNGGHLLLALENQNTGLYRSTDGLDTFTKVPEPKASKAGGTTSG